MTELRIVGAEDTEAVRRLWTYCFDDSDAFVQWYFTAYYRAENTLGVYADDQRLIAATQIIPYSISLRKQPVAAGYIVGVSTAPEARRQGLGRQMLAASLEEMRRRQMYLSLLMPFAGGFYYRFGWQFAYFKRQAAVELTELKEAAAPYGQIMMVALGDRLSEAAEIYRDFCRDKNGYVLRDQDNWARVVADAALEKAYCALLYEQGKAEGYAFYAFDGENIRILEMAYTGYQARAGLLDFFYGHRSHKRRLLWQASEDDPLIYQLTSSKDAVHLYPYLMVRVVDVAGFLTSLVYGSDCAPLVLQVADELAVWNNGCFRFAVCDGCAIVTPVAKDTAWDIALDVGTLGQLAMGSMTAAQLFAQGRIQSAAGHLPHQWSALWPKENNYIAEEY